MIYHLDSVTKTYGQRIVLNIPAMQVHAGEILCLVGPSGAGKSTLLRLLAMLESPCRGRVCVQQNGHSFDRRSMTIEDQRRIAMVFQRPALLSRSVWQNVAYGLKLRGASDYDSRIEEVLERVAMLDLADAHPDTLSGGELQRVAVARTLVLEPDILLLDEPTANLDPVNVRIIESLIREQNQQYGTTIILVTHNIFQAKRLADRVALILDSKLVEVAPVETFFTHPRDQRTADFVSGDLVY